MRPGNSEFELLELIRSARNGDVHALGLILEKHRDVLRIAAQSELGGQLAARIDASDVVQQTFLSACRLIRQFDGITTGEFAAWLARIQERNLQDAIRQHLVVRKRDDDFLN